MGQCSELWAAAGAKRTQEKKNFLLYDREGTKTNPTSHHSKKSEVVKDWPVEIKLQWLLRMILRNHRTILVLLDGTHFFLLFLYFYIKIWRFLGDTYFFVWWSNAVFTGKGGAKVGMFAEHQNQFYWNN